MKTLTDFIKESNFTFRLNLKSIKVNDLTDQWLEKNYYWDGDSMILIDQTVAYFDPKTEKIKFSKDLKDDVVEKLKEYAKRKGDCPRSYKGSKFDEEILTKMLDTDERF
jgi:hypothetical protein